MPSGVRERLSMFRKKSVTPEQMVVIALAELHQEVQRLRQEIVTFKKEMVTALSASPRS